MTPRIQRLRAEVASDLGTFRAKVEELEGLPQLSGAGRGTLAEAAVALHHAYGAIESALAHIARSIDDGLPEGPDWHQALLRDKEGREVDFLVVRDGRPFWLVECKSNDTAPSPALLHFVAKLTGARAFQLVTKPDYDRMYSQSGVRVLDYERFLAGLV